MSIVLEIKCSRGSTMSFWLRKPTKPDPFSRHMWILSQFHLPITLLLRQTLIRVLWATKLSKTRIQEKTMMTKKRERRSGSILNIFSHNFLAYPNSVTALLSWLITQIQLYYRLILGIGGISIWWFVRLLRRLRQTLQQVRRGLETKTKRSGSWSPFRTPWQHISCLRRPDIHTYLFLAPSDPRPRPPIFKYELKRKRNYSRQNTTNRAEGNTLRSRTRHSWLERSG